MTAAIATPPVTRVAGAPYQVMPPLSAEEYAQLKAAIQARGVQVPVEVDEHGAVLDGHHRVAICRELGIAEWPQIVRRGLSEAEKRTHARQLNLARRHLNRRQKRQLIEQQLRDTPQVSNNHLATGLDVSDKTVASVRRELEATSEIPKFDRTIGADGKARPRNAEGPKTIGPAARRARLELRRNKAAHGYFAHVKRLPKEKRAHALVTMLDLLGIRDDVLELIRPRSAP